jgi:hypothetical protein
VRRFVAAGICTMLLIGGCSDIDELRVGPTPICSTTSRGTLLLMAQAVPTAQAIPCIESLPEGWIYDAAEIEVGEANLVFDNPGVGKVTVELTAGCEAGGTPTESPFPEAVATVENVGGVERHSHVMEDSCVIIEYPPRLAATEMTRQISFVSRESLRQSSDLDL